MIACILAAAFSMQQVTSGLAPVPTPLQFSVTHDGTLDTSLTGRVYVMMSKGMPPIGGPNWNNPEPFFAVDVVDWNANEPLILRENADAMDGPPSSIGEGPWKAVAIFRALNNSSRLAVPGGLYGERIQIEGGGSDGGVVGITINMLVPERSWRLHKNLRLVEERSDLLSEFYGRDVEHGACVIVPDDYDPDREEPYPVMYWIGGFGSDHYGGRFMKALFTASDYDDQICRVILNAQAYSGHHVFADSANNGPRMTALFTEFIPYLEEKYNLGGSANKRYLSGHSSGGWSAMWLQVQNPEFFGGVWSLAPDPVDFHYFQTVDLYADNANMYFDELGDHRPIARRGTTPNIFAKGFVAMDDVIKDGGQIGSFEWVFSPRGIDGRPLHMFDRDSGEIDTRVVEYWKQYDIRHILETNWETLSPKLKGKINIVAGGVDTFYLETAVIAMQTFFAEHNFDAMVRVVEDGDHGAVFRTSVIREMDEYIANRLGLVNRQSPRVSSTPK